MLYVQVQSEETFFEKYSFLWNIKFICTTAILNQIFYDHWNTFKNVCSEQYHEKTWADIFWKLIFFIYTTFFIAQKPTILHNITFHDEMSNSSTLSVSSLPHFYCVLHPLISFQPPEPYLKCMAQHLMLWPWKKKKRRHPGPPSNQVPGLLEIKVVIQVTYI